MKDGVQSDVDSTDAAERALHATVTQFAVGETERPGIRDSKGAPDDMLRRFPVSGHALIVTRSAPASDPIHSPIP